MSEPSQGLHDDCMQFSLLQAGLAFLIHKSGRQNLKNGLAFCIFWTSFLQNQCQRKFKNRTYQSLHRS